MRHRMLVSVLLVFAFTFSLTLGFYIRVNADNPGRCDCCQVDDLKGAYKWDPLIMDYACNCNGCGSGSTIWNPHGCVLECRKIP
jgi:hypothetical protein